LTPISGRLYETPGEGTEYVFRFPVAFRPPAFASWASCSRPRISSPYGRLTPPHRRGPDGVSTFPTSELRPDWAPSLLRDGGAPTAGRSSPAAACRFPAASPLPRYNLPPPKLQMTKHARIHVHSPARSSPLPVAPGWSGVPWASPSSFEPRRYQRRTLRWGQAIEHSPGSHSRHQSILQSMCSLISCDLVSHAPPLTAEVGGCVGGLIA
jgi:hypothetical protein